MLNKLRTDTTFSTKKITHWPKTYGTRSTGHKVPEVFDECLYILWNDAGEKEAEGENLLSCKALFLFFLMALREKEERGADSVPPPARLACELIKILTYNKRHTHERSIFYVTAQTGPCSAEGEGGGGGDEK